MGQQLTLVKECDYISDESNLAAARAGERAFCLVRYEIPEVTNTFRILPMPHNRFRESRILADADQKHLI